MGDPGTLLSGKEKREGVHACALRAAQLRESARPSLTFHFRACIARAKFARDRARISVIIADPLRIRCVKSTEKFSRLSAGAPTFPNGRASLAIAPQLDRALIDSRKEAFSLSLSLARRAAHSSSTTLFAAGKFKPYPSADMTDGSFRRQKFPRRYSDRLI